MKKSKVKNPKPSEKSKNILADLVWDNSNAGKKNIPSAAKNIPSADKNIPTKRSKAKVVKPSPSKKFTTAISGKNGRGKSRHVKGKETDIRPLAELIAKTITLILLYAVTKNQNKGKKKGAKNPRKKK